MPLWVKFRITPRLHGSESATVDFVRVRFWVALTLSIVAALAFDLLDTWTYHGTAEAVGIGDVVELSAATALPSGELIQGQGGATVNSAGVTVDVAGSAGTAPNNAGTASEVARSDHEHRVGGGICMGFEATPSTGEFAMNMPVNSECAGDDLDVTEATIAAIVQGSGTMTFNIRRYNAAGVSQGDLFSASQSYSNTGDDRQEFATNQNNNNIAVTDVFRWNFVTVNGQDDFATCVWYKCQNTD